MATCETCTHFAPLKPGHAAICFEKWKGLPWNAAVPLTTKDGYCEKHQAKASTVLPSAQGGGNAKVEG